MAERPRREGWRVPERVPALAAIATLALIAVLLLAAGTIYRRTLAPQHRPPVTTFPAPGVETRVHDGVEDPPRPRPTPRRDAAIEAAKRTVVAEGWAR